MFKFLSLVCASLLLSGCATHHPPRLVQKADYVVLEKTGRSITLWSEGQVLAHYPVLSLGPNPIGHKEYEGDGRTPEGLYLIDEKHESQSFQKFLRISYPNKDDAARAKALGLKPGGFVGIHGDKGGLSGFFKRMDPNWTQGCISVRNDAINDIYDRVEVGTPILIRP